MFKKNRKLEGYGFNTCFCLNPYWPNETDIWYRKSIFLGTEGAKDIDFMGGKFYLNGQETCFSDDELNNLGSTRYYHSTSELERIITDNPFLVKSEEEDCYYTKFLKIQKSSKFTV